MVIYLNNIPKILGYINIMRRRKYNLKLIFSIFLILLLVNVSYAYLKSSLEIKGTVYGNQVTSHGYIVDRESNPNLDIVDFGYNYWLDSGMFKFHYNFKVKNVGNVDLDNFKLILTFNSNVENLDMWSYTYGFNENIININAPSVNLTVGREIEISFQAGSYNENFKLNRIKLDVDTSIEEPEEGNVLVNFTKSNSWGSYTIQYNTDVINNTDKKINSWTIEITLDSGVTYVSGWNGIFSQEGNILTIKNASYNGVIEVDRSVSFGLQITAPTADYVPSDYKVFVR